MSYSKTCGLDSGAKSSPVSFEDFIERKSQLGGSYGFDASLPDFLFDFQRHLVEWAIRRGRAAIFADCGLGSDQRQDLHVHSPGRECARHRPGLGGIRSGRPGPRAGITHGHFGDPGERSGDGREIGRAHV